MSAAVRLITAGDLASLLAEDPDPAEALYAPANSEDFSRAASRLGWFSDGRWLRPAVPAQPLPRAIPDQDARASGVCTS